MSDRYKHDENYVKYQKVDLRDEFLIAQRYLLTNEEHANDEVYKAVDEIYHMLYVKQLEVDELIEENQSLRFSLSCDSFMSLLQEASEVAYPGKKAVSNRQAKMTCSILVKNGIYSIESLMDLSIVDATRFKSVNGGIISVISIAQELQRNKKKSEEVTS